MWVGGQRHSSDPAALYPWEWPGMHCTGGWVGPRPRMDMWGKSRPHRVSIPKSFSQQRVAIPTELYVFYTRVKSTFFVILCTRSLWSALTLILLMWRIWWAPNNASEWQMGFNPYPTAFPYGNGMVLHFYQQQESSTTKTVHRVINKGLKTYV